MPSIVGSDAVFRLAARYDPKRVLKRLIGRSHDMRHLVRATISTRTGWSGRRRWLAAGKGSVGCELPGNGVLPAQIGLYKRLWRCLRDFDYLSVRDPMDLVDGKQSDFGTVKPQRCPDPVFCLNRAFDLPEREKIPVDLSRYILFWGALGEPLVAALREEAGRRDTGRHSWRTRKMAPPGLANIGLGLPLSPLRWYHALATAGGYVGTRFHALVSCMANGTPS